MRIKDLVEGNVIDARDRFKKQNSIDPSELQSQVSAALTSHKDFENWVKEKLNKIKSFPNNLISSEEKLAVAPLYQSFEKNVPFTKVLMWAITDPDDTPSHHQYLAKILIKSKKEKILQIIELQLTALYNLEKQIRQSSDAVSMLRYTELPYIKSELNELHSFYRDVKF